MTNSQQQQQQKDYATAERERAARLQADYQITVTAIRGNSDLTDRARRRQIAEAHDALKTAMKALQESEAQKLDEAMAGADKRIFAPLHVRKPEAAAGVRDARDRASRIKSPNEAAEELARAEQVGDEVLAAAIVEETDRRAGREPLPDRQQAWGRLLVDYVARRPELHDAAELSDRINDLRAASPVMSPFLTLTPPEVREHERDLLRDEPDKGDHADLDRFYS